MVDHIPKPPALWTHQRRAMSDLPTDGRYVFACRCGTTAVETIIWDAEARAILNENCGYYHHDEYGAWFDAPHPWNADP